MRKLPLPITTLLLCGLPLLANAHTGGALDADGCHADHRTGSYHCHRGEAAGYTFPNKAAMQEAVRTGVFPEKSVEAEGFFSKLWPFGKKHEQEPTLAEPAPAAGSESDRGAEAAPAPAPGDAPGVETGSVVTPAPAPATPQQRDIEQRLKVLQGLHEMGLISKEEYEAKRQAILDEL